MVWRVVPGNALAWSKGLVVSFTDHLCETKTKLELAKMLVQVAKENAALRDRVGELTHRIFWTEVQQRKDQP